MKKIFTLLCAGLLFGLSTRAQAPLYRCVFQNQTDFTANWTTSSTRGNTWHARTVSQFSSDNENTYCAEITDNAGYAGKDYMILKNPVTIPAGQATLSYWWSTFRIYGETYSVLYGKTNNPAEMTQLARYEDVNNPIIDEDANPGTWLNVLLPFDAEEGGDYYFAFCYESVDQMYLFIDEVEVYEGVITGKADLQVSAINLPVSSCELGVEEISFTVSNHGNAEADSIRFTCLLNGETAWDSVVIRNLRPMQSFTFTNLVDLSESGLYDITVIASLPDSAAVEDEKSGKIAVRHWAPVTEFPFETNFMSEDAVDRDWVPQNRGGWEHYPEYGFVQIAYGGMLFSRCMEFTQGQPYHLFVNALLGMDNSPCSFDILYGKTGTDPDNWKVLSQIENEYYDEPVDGHFDFVPEESGSYTFAIRHISGSVCFFYIKISELSNYDLALWRYDYMPTQIPVEHAAKKIEIPVVVENVGENAVDSAKAVLEYNGEILDEVRFEMGERGEYYIITLNGALPFAKVDSVYTLTARTEIIGAPVDGYLPDNELDFTFRISDKILAYDSADETLCDTLSGFGGYIIGEPMYIANTDTLTGIEVLFKQGLESYDMPLYVYRFDDVDIVLGDMIYSGTHTKSADGGVVDFEIPARLLTPGWYIFMVGMQDYTLVLDKKEGGRCYTYYQDRLIEQPQNGHAAIRAIFGHNAAAAAKDVAVTEILRPRTRGLYAENQPVEARIANMGFETVETEVSVSVDGNASAITRTVSLEAYASTIVTLEADLSAVGTHTLTVSAALADDANPEDNTLDIEVESIESADPYRMDFENCDDWTLNDFNPAWRTVDMDGEFTFPSFWHFPHAGEPAAFMVFNQNYMEGDMAAVNCDLFAYQGDKFGMSMCAYHNSNDDWLISPKLRMPDDFGRMDFAVKSYDDYYGQERYEVWVSKTDRMEDFVKIYEDSAAAEWESVSLDLSDFKGMDLYIAFRCVSFDLYFFLLDDIHVFKPGEEREDEANEKTDKAAVLNLSPNPVREMITINAYGTAMEEVSIYNLSGRMVYSGKVSDGQTFKYNVKGLTSGLYFARIKTSEGTSTLKFVVE